MSYARFGNTSDVYVFLNVSGYFDCCACRLREEARFDTTDEMIAHLREHVAAGHQVPDYTIPALEEERVENDQWIATGEDLD